MEYSPLPMKSSLGGSPFSVMRVDWYWLTVVKAGHIYVVYWIGVGHDRSIKYLCRGRSGQGWLRSARSGRVCCAIGSVLAYDRSPCLGGLPPDER